MIQNQNSVLENNRRVRDIIHETTSSGNKRRIPARLLKGIVPEDQPLGKSFQHIHRPGGGKLGFFVETTPGVLWGKRHKLVGTAHLTAEPEILAPRSSGKTGFKEGFRLLKQTLKDLKR